MQKVVFSVSKVNKDDRLTGVGYLADSNLIVPAMSGKGKSYIRVFEGVTEKCRLIPTTTDEYHSPHSHRVYELQE
jgi:hypothetical protein